MEKTLYDFRFKEFSNTIIYGQSSSGKSTICCDLALQRNKLYETPVDLCIFFYQSYQSIFDDLRAKDSSIIFVDQIEHLENVLQSTKYSHGLIIFDDFMLNSIYENTRYMIDWYLRRSHHQRASLIFQFHVVYPKGLRALTVNNHNYIFLKTNHQQQLHYLFRQLSPYNWRSLLAIYIECCEKTNYGVFTMCLHPKVESILKYRNFVIPLEGGKVFVLK